MIAAQKCLHQQEFDLVYYVEGSKCLSVVTISIFFTSKAGLQGDRAKKKYFTCEATSGKFQPGTLVHSQML